MTPDVREVPPPAEVWAGSKAVVIDYVQAAGIELRAAEPEWTVSASHMYGVPIRIDPALPANALRIGDRMLFHHAGYWYEVDLTLIAAPCRDYAAEIADIGRTWGAP